MINSYSLRIINSRHQPIGPQGPDFKENGCAYSKAKTYFSDVNSTGADVVKDFDTQKHSTDDINYETNFLNMFGSFADLDLRDSKMPIYLATREDKIADAFNKFSDDTSYYGTVCDDKGKIKDIQFTNKKTGERFSYKQLSSGEKQIFIEELFFLQTVPY